jgi:acetyl esterase/lipase
MRLRSRCAVWTIVLATIALAWVAGSPRAGAQVATDVVYGTVGDRDLLVDIYMPDGVESPPLVVWVHGGAWRAGGKQNPPGHFEEAGYALASVDFRRPSRRGRPARRSRPSSRPARRRDRAPGSLPWR